MAQAEGMRLSSLARGKAALSRAAAASFEKLEGRVMFDGDTVVNDLDPTSGNNAAYVIDLAAGDATTPPPENTALAQQTAAPSGGAVVMAEGSSGSTGGESGGGDSTGAAPPATAPATAPVASRNPSTAPATRSPSDFRYVLRPGTGFAGPTTQPAAVGNPGDVGYDAKAIARWDVVPYQTFTNMFNVGVVAFHREGIDRVEFSVNGGDWTAVRHMTENPETGVVEYTATLHAKDFNDGVLEVRAVAYPIVGEPRVLESLRLNANANGTLKSIARYVSPTGNDANDGLTPQTPKATTNAAAFSIHQAQGNADGGTIYLLPGTYTLNSATWNTNSSTVNRWMTVTAAPGVDRSSVIIAGTAGAGFNSKLVRLSNLTITGSVYSGGPLVDHAWYDNVHFQSTGVGPSSWSGFFVTDATFSNVDVAISGATLVRNVHIDGLGGDAFSESLCIINSSVTNYAQTPGAHSNLYQIVGDVQNVVLYGVRSTSRDVQPFQYNVTPVDHAIVNCDIDATNWFAVVLGAQMRNVLHINSRFTGSYVVLGEFQPVNVVFDNCTLNSQTVGMPGFPTTAGVVFR